MSNYKVKLSRIKAFAFDVDGVLTDGSLLATDTGDLLRSHNAKDGYALKLAVSHNYPVSIITGGSSESIVKRYSPMGLKDIFIKSFNKLPDFMLFCSMYGLDTSEILYMGDDIPDISILKICGLAACPSDAVEEVKAICDLISPYPGGKGCVRDVIEQTMKIQGKWLPAQNVFSG